MYSAYIILLAVISLAMVPEVLTNALGCKVACEKCRDKWEHPAIVAVYCRMCEECKEKLRERLLMARRYDTEEGDHNEKVRRRDDAHDHTPSDNQQETRATEIVEVYDIADCPGPPPCEPLKLDVTPETTTTTTTSTITTTMTTTTTTTTTKPPSTYTTTKPPSSKTTTEKPQSGSCPPYKLCVIKPKTMRPFLPPPPPPPPMPFYPYMPGIPMYMPPMCGLPQPFTPCPTIETTTTTTTSTTHKPGLRELLEGFGINTDLPDWNFLAADVPERVPTNATTVPTTTMAPFITNATGKLELGAYDTDDLSVFIGIPKNFSIDEAAQRQLSLGDAPSDQDDEWL